MESITHRHIFGIRGTLTRKVHVSKCNINNNQQYFRSVIRMFGAMSQKFVILTTVNITENNPSFIQAF